MRNLASRLLAALLVAAAALLALTAWAGRDVLTDLYQGSADTQAAHLVLRPGTEPAEVQPLRDTLASWPGVAGVAWRSGEDNLAIVQQTFAQEARPLQAGDLPPSLVVTLRDPAQDLPALQPRLQSLPPHPALLSVEVAAPEDLQAVAGLGGLLPLPAVLAALTLLVAALLVAALQRARALAERDEQDLLWHLGADPRHLVTPRLRDALASGAAGGALAALALAALAAWGRPVLLALGWSRALPAEPSALLLPLALAFALAFALALTGTAASLLRAGSRP